MSNASQTITTFIGAETLLPNVFNDHTHSRGWVNWQRVLQDIEPDRFRSGAASVDHANGSANYLYADSHVDAVPAAKMKALIDAGQNIAIPGLAP